MKTTSMILQEALLKGMSITKFDFMNMTPQHSVCLAQRVEELRRNGWNIKDRTVVGKGGLKEYYMEKPEIDRLTGHGQQHIEEPNAPQMALNEPENEEYEQLGLLVGGRNLSERW